MDWHSVLTILNTQNLKIARTSVIKSYLDQYFHGSTLEDNFETAQHVHILFHGYGNTHNCTKAWEKFIPKHQSDSFIHLNAPFKYYYGYQWFEYVDDQSAMHQAACNHDDMSLDELMYHYKLDERRDSFSISVAYIKTLTEMIMSQGKTVSFIGSSQGAAIAFSTASVLNHLDGFRGGFFHHMAGIYADFIPKENTTIYVRDSAIDGIHSMWSTDEIYAVGHFAKAVHFRTCMEVHLDKLDLVVPHQLSNFLPNINVRYKRRKDLSN